MGWFSDIPKHLPTATGPYVPGMTDILIGHDHEFPIVRLFYPTKSKEDRLENSKKWLSWIVDQNYLYGLAKVIMLYPIVLKLLFWWIGSIKIPALYGEKPRLDDKLKVVVMSHGLGGNRFLYTNICNEMASRGFLVASIEHKDNSACYTYYYKSKTDAQNDIRTDIQFQHVKLGETHYAKRNRQVKKRGHDCVKIIDFLNDLNSGKNIPKNTFDDTKFHANINFKLDDLVGKLDMDNLTVMGHSFGAATALYTMSIRPDIKHGILMDPWMFPIKDEHVEEKIKRPLIFINTQTFHISTNVTAMSKFLTDDASDREMYTILHTTHENQTDTVLIIGYWLNWFMKKLDPITALNINNSLIFTFLNKCMKFPSDIEHFKNYLNEQKHNVTQGLTKPWM